MPPWGSITTLTDEKLAKIESKGEKLAAVDYWIGYLFQVKAQIAAGTYKP